MIHKYWVHFRAECSDTDPTEYVEQGFPVALEKLIGFEDIGKIEIGIANAVGANRQSQGGKIMVAVLGWTKLEEALVIVPSGRIN